MTITPTSPALMPAMALFTGAGFLDSSPVSEDDVAVSVMGS